MRVILAALTTNRVKGLFLGAFVTMVIQSSSATTVMLVSFVQAQLMTFAQSLGIILGADIGTTITAFLAALALGSGAAIAVAIAHCLFNIFGGLLIYPVKAIPIFIAQKIGDTALTSRAIPLIYVAVAFFIIPMLIIFFLSDFCDLAFSFCTADLG